MTGNPSAPDAQALPLCDAAAGQLVVIDVQEKLLAAMPEAVAEQVVRNIALLADAAAQLQIPVLRTEQYPRGLGPTVAELDRRLPPPAATKTRFACCGEPGFDAALIRPQVILAGVETHVCVLQTAAGLLAAGRQVFVVADAACSRRKADHRNALARMAAAGAHVTCTESVLFEWLRDAAHPRFKDISRRLR